MASCHAGGGGLDAWAIAVTANSSGMINLVLRKSAGITTAPPSWFEHLLDAVEVGDQLRMTLIVAFAQQDKNMVEQLLQRGLVKQRLNVVPIVVRGNQ
jgi:hypothetical protein